MVGPLAVLIVLGTVYALLLGGKGHSFRPKLARTSVRRSSGNNLGSMLAVVGLAALILDFGNSPLANIPGVAPVLAAIVVILIIGIVVTRSIAEVLAAVIGIGLLVMTVGVSGAIQLGILIALMLWLLGAARGFFA